MGTLDLLFGGGGGYFVRVLYFYIWFLADLFFVVFSLVVYSMVSCSHMGCALFSVLHAVFRSCLSYCALLILLMLVSHLVVMCVF